MKNIVLLGGSNSVLINGLQQSDINLIKLALDTTICIQNLYELKRKYELIRTTDLIITESNVNDSYNINNINNFRVLEWFYKELLQTKKKVLVVILSFYKYNYKATNHIHRYFISKYQFNFIDLHKYYDLFKLKNFSRLREGNNSSHQFDFILRELGRNIAYNVNNFRFSEANLKLNNLEFLVCNTGELTRENLRSIKNSIYEENYFRIEKGIFLIFPEKYYNYYIIVYYTWNNIDDAKIVAPWDWLKRRAVKSTLIISDNREKVELKPCLDNIVYKTKIKNLECEPQNTTNELKNLQENITHKKQLLEVQNLGQNFNLKSLKIKEIQESIDLKILEKIKMQKELKQYGNIIYIEKYYQSTKQRIYNRLSYGLGFYAIKKSKTLLGWIGMPIILLSIFISCKQEQKIYQEKIKKDPPLKLPPLELYTDYQETRKKESSLYINFGQAIMNILIKLGIRVDMLNLYLIFKN